MGPPKLKDGPEVGTFPGDNSSPNRRHRQQSNGRHQTLWPDSSARQNHWTCVRRGKESSGTTWLTIISRLSSTAYPHPGPTAHFSFGSPTDNITSSTPMPEKRWSRAQLQFPKQILILCGSYGGISTAHYLLKHAVPPPPQQRVAPSHPCQPLFANHVSSGLSSRADLGRHVPTRKALRQHP